MARDVRLIRSPISIAGMVLTTISAVVFIVVGLGDLFGIHTNPYLGIVFFIALPALFVLGLLLIPLGAWIERRRRRAGKQATSAEWPRLDLNVPAQRRFAVAIFALTMANVVIVSLAAYRGVEYLDSVSFCGGVCHTPMKPQRVAHQQGQHAQIECVACHVGEGARSFVKAKLAGTRQLLAVAANSYPRPIVAAPEDVIASHIACEQCHVARQFRGDVSTRIVEYSDDENNSQSVTTLHLHVGGGDGTTPATGIHWHADPATVVEYVTSDDRQTIPWVRVTDSRNGVREYMAANATEDQLTHGVRRRMECTDCHNRAGHAIPATAERAVDGAIARGDIPATLPFVRREAVNALKASYPSEDAALNSIAQALRQFYRGEDGSSALDRSVDVERAVLVSQGIYRRSVFPEMKVSFGTYASNIGHVHAPGCFRCHDEEHVASDGRVIGRDCESCHAIE